MATLVFGCPEYITRFVAINVISASPELSGFHNKELGFIHCRLHCITNHEFVKKSRIKQGLNTFSKKFVFNTVETTQVSQPLLGIYDFSGTRCAKPKAVVFFLLI